MGKLRRAILFSFRAKVIIPVVAVMVLLMALSMGLVNQRVTAQFESEAAEQLMTEDAGFKRMQEMRENELLLRYSYVVKEARYKSLGQLSHSEQSQLSTDARNTIRGVLDDLVEEGIADVVVFSTATGEHVTSTRDLRLVTAELEAACKPAIRQALEGQPKVDTLPNGDRLFDTVSLPIRLGDQIVGTVTFGVENSLAREFYKRTQSDLVLLSDDHVVASTLRASELRTLLESSGQRTKQAAGGEGRRIEKTILEDSHFLCLSGTLNAQGGPHQISYRILSSYEKPMQALRATQRLIWIVAGFAILFGAVALWFLVRKVTEPLQELRDSVEAVGQGDFSRRIEVSSMDECAELAQVFNQMTENLKISREQLEKTVETLKTTQAQLIQSEKLSGIGEFVAGVAHELNNPLTSVMGFAELLKQADQDPQHQRFLDMIHKSAARCTKIVQALLSFARRHKPEKKPACVNGLIEAALEILNYQLRTSNIEVRTCLDPNLPQAMVDSHQVQQVFLNIINNARQAIEAHQPKGLITVSTEVRGPNVRVIIKDSGPGISPENLSRLFDPFFTTKEVGKGTGLGLSLCYGIIKEHGGTIIPSSKPGEGATFVIELPITHQATPAPEEKRTPDTDTINPHEGAGRKVLVIDDEEPILQMLSECLSRRGYTVDVAADGETGLRRLSQNKYDVTLCDWKMPGLTGRDVYERLRLKNPAQSERMIFITGDVINEKTRQFLEEQKKVCLPKPFTQSEFREAIAKVLATG